MTQKTKTIEEWRALAPFYVMGQKVPLSLSGSFKPIQFDIKVKVDELLVLFDFSTLNLKEPQQLIRTISYLSEHYPTLRDSIFLVYSAEAQPLHLRGYREIILQVLLVHPSVHVRPIEGSIKSKAHYDFNTFVMVTEDRGRLIERIRRIESLIETVVNKEIEELTSIYVNFLRILEDHNQGLTSLFNKIIDKVAVSTLTRKSDRIARMADAFLKETRSDRIQAMRRALVCGYLMDEKEVRESFLMRLSEHMPFTEHAQTLDDLAVCLQPFFEDDELVVPEKFEAIFTQFLGRYRNGVFNPPLFIAKLEHAKKIVALLTKRLDFLPEAMGALIRIFEYNYLQLYCMQSILDLYQKGSTKAGLHNPFTFAQGERKRFGGIMTAFSGQGVFFQIKKFLYEEGIVIN